MYLVHTHFLVCTYHCSIFYQYIKWKWTKKRRKLTNCSDNEIHLKNRWGRTVVSLGEQENWVECVFRRRSTSLQLGYGSKSSVRAQTCVNRRCYGKNPITTASETKTNIRRKGERKTARRNIIQENCTIRITKRTPVSNLSKTKIVNKDKLKR